MKHLVVAEKPSVGRDIARILECTEKHQGYITGESYIVTWGVGHLVTNCMPGEINPEYEVWRRANLPIMPDPIPLAVIPKTKTQFEIVRSLMNDPNIDEIICATDAGREGELIFRYIYQMAGCTKPVQRLWISSMTPQAIREGFSKLRPSSEYDNLYKSALCRSDADWLIGINASRVYSILGGSQLSVGRVQTPTLKFLVDREQERRNFVPEKYGTLEADFGGFTGLWFDPSKKGDEAYRIEEDLFNTMNELRAALVNTDAVVCEYSSESVSVPAPLLYDLTSLQRDANRIHGYSAKETLSYAQDLYERRKAITYPRTDSKHLSHDMVSTLKGRLEKLDLPVWSVGVTAAKRSTKLLFGRFINDSKVSDHHAIIPTGYCGVGADWTEGEKNVFDLIARRYIAMFLPDRVYDKQVLIAEAKEGNLFRAEGKRIVDNGWDVISRVPHAQSQTIPEVAVGEKLHINDLILNEKETTPPPLHTDASLLYAMEHAGEQLLPDDEEASGIGLGTPATRADMIEKIISKKYAKRIGRAIIPTNAGMKLIDILRSEEKLTSAAMTVAWEKQLAEIGAGEYSSDAFMAGIRNHTEEIVANARVDCIIVGKCPLCGQDVIIGMTGDSYSCVNEECDFFVWKAEKGHPVISPDDMKTMLDTGKVEKPTATLMISKEAPFIIAEKKEPIPIKKDELTVFLTGKGITPVDKTSHGGAFWIPGDMSMRPLIIEIENAHSIKIPFSKDSKALKHKPGWYIKLECFELH